MSKSAVVANDRRNTIMIGALAALKANPNGLYLKELARKAACSGSALRQHIARGVELEVFFAEKRLFKGCWCVFVGLTPKGVEMESALTPELFKKAPEPDYIDIHREAARTNPNHFVWSMNMGGCHG